MVKTVLEDKYVGGKIPIALKNEASTCRKMYYDRYNFVMVNHSVNEFYTRFLFALDAIPQDVAFPLDFAATIFKNLSPDAREFLIS